MSPLLLTVHVLAVVLTLGPITVAASMFPRVARAAAAAPEEPALAAVLAVLYRICRVYAVVALFVPAFGLATAVSLNVLTEPWLLTAIGLTIVAAVVLAARILPIQRQLLAEPAVTRAVRRLGMFTGVFGLLWVAVTVLMVVQPGSTTGT